MAGDTEGIGDGAKIDLAIWHHGADGVDNLGEILGIDSRNLRAFGRGAFLLRSRWSLLGGDLVGLRRLDDAGIEGSEAAAALDELADNENQLVGMERLLEIGIGTCLEYTRRSS